MNLYFLSNIVFYGFFVYSLLYIIFKPFPFYKNNTVYNKIEQAAISVAILAGILYAAIWIFEFGTLFFGPDNKYLLRRMSGPYAVGFWLQPILYAGLPLLLNVPKIARNILLRFIIAFLIFFNFEKFVIIVTSLHRDYLPSSWTMYDGYSIFGWIIADSILKIIIFSSFVTVAYYLKNRKTL